MILLVRERYLSGEWVSGTYRNCYRLCLNNNIIFANNKQPIARMSARIFLELCSPAIGKPTMSRSVNQSINKSMEPSTNSWVNRSTNRASYDWLCNRLVARPSATKIVTVVRVGLVIFLLVPSTLAWTKSDVEVLQTILNDILCGVECANVWIYFWFHVNMCSCYPQINSLKTMPRGTQNRQHRLIRMRSVSELISGWVRERYLSGEGVSGRVTIECVIDWLRDRVPLRSSLWFGFGVGLIICPLVPSTLAWRKSDVEVL